MGKLKIVFLSWGFVFKDFLWGFYLQRCRHREWRHGAWLCRPKLWEWRLRNWEIDRVIAWIPTIVEDARILILIFSKMWERRDPLCSSNDKNWQKYNFVRRVKMWENVQPFIFLKTIQLQHNMVHKKCINETSLSTLSTDLTIDKWENKTKWFDNNVTDKVYVRGNKIVSGVLGRRPLRCPMLGWSQVPTVPELSDTGHGHCVQPSYSYTLTSHAAPAPALPLLAR